MSEPVELTEADITTIIEAFQKPDRTVAMFQAATRIKAAARREALLEAREDIRARRRTFSDLNADPQYLAAMDDAFGLVNNRIAGPERDEESGR